MRKRPVLSLAIDADDGMEIPLHGGSSSIKEVVTSSCSTGGENSDFTAEIFEQLYDRRERIGRGAFGEVYSYQHKQTGKIVAVKFLPGRFDSETLKSFTREIDVLKSFHHGNLVNMLFSFFDKAEGLFVIGLEYCDLGSLRDLLDTTNFRFHEKMIQEIFHSALQALDFMHQNHVLHLDIKPDNLLLMSSEGEEENNNLEGKEREAKSEEGGRSVKVADFGTARIRENDVTQGLTHQTGTFRYMSPEIMQGEGAKWAADIWSLGLTITELATGKSPWEGSVKEEGGSEAWPVWAYICNFTKGNVPQIPLHLSKDLRKLLSRCVQIDRNERASASELLKDAYFAKLGVLPSDAESLDAYEALKAEMKKNQRDGADKAACWTVHEALLTGRMGIIKGKTVRGVPLLRQQQATCRNNPTADALAQLDEISL